MITIGIAASKNADIEISTIAKNLDTDLKIYLEDRKLRSFVLSENSEGTFTFIIDQTLNGSWRFYLHTISGTLNTVKEDFSTVLIHPPNKKFNIKNLSWKSGILEVYGLQSKQVFKTKAL